MLFFKDKLGYILERYKLLHSECQRRGFEVTNYAEAFIGFDCSGNWKPKWNDKEVIINRLREKFRSMKDIRYKGVKLTVEQADALSIGSLL